MSATIWQICLMFPSCTGGIWQSCGGIGCIEVLIKQIGDIFNSCVGWG